MSGKEISEERQKAEEVECDRLRQVRGCPSGAVSRAKGGFELRSEVHLPAEQEEFTEIVTVTSDFTEGRFRIRKEVLETFGHTAGCPGRRAVNRGTIAKNHSEEHGKRFAE